MFIIYKETPDVFPIIGVFCIKILPYTFFYVFIYDAISYINANGMKSDIFFDKIRYEKDLKSGLGQGGIDMKKKVLACLLALSMICSSGGITWAAADGQAEVFHSGESAAYENSEDVAAQREEELPAAEEIPTEEEFSKENEIPMSTEAAEFQEEMADFGDGTDQEPEIEMFSSGMDESMFSSEGTVQNGEALEAGGKITIQPDSSGKTSFTLNVSQEGIYKLEYSSDIIHIEIPGIYGSYAAKKFIVRLNAGTYTVNCENVDEKVSITAEQLPDIQKLELVSSEFPAFYNGEDIFSSDPNFNVILKITDIEGNVETTNNGGYSQTYGHCNNWIDSERMLHISMNCAPNIVAEPIQLNYKDVTAADPLVINIDSENDTISQTDKDNYCFQFKTASEGSYKINLNNGSLFQDSPYLSVREITGSSASESAFGKYIQSEAVMSLKADTTYLVRIVTSDFTGELPVSVKQIRTIESFTLADGQKMPSEMIRWYTKLLPQTEFVITYTNGTNDIVTYKDGSSEYGQIFMTNLDGFAVYALDNDNNWDSPGHFVTGPKLVDFDSATAMTEISMESVNKIPLSDVYLDGAYFKFQAQEEGIYDFNIKNAKTVHTTNGTYEGDDDISISQKLNQGEIIYFIAKNLTADAVEIEIEKNPVIESITLKRGSIEGKTFIADILYNNGFHDTIKDCLFEVTYSDGTPSELVSSDWNQASKYYGDLNVYTDAYGENSIVTGDKKIWVGFNKSDVISQEYTIHILDKPSPSDMTALTINQETPLTKGPHDLQWFSFKAPAEGSYLFQVTAADGDISAYYEHYWAKEPAAMAKSAQGLQWNFGWEIRPVKLQAGETYYAGISAEAPLRVRASAVQTIQKIEPVHGKLSTKYIKEFLEYSDSISAEFNVFFGENDYVPVKWGEALIKDNVNYGFLNYDWPQDDNNQYISGDLKVYIGNSYVEGRDYKQPITVSNLSDVKDLPALTLQNGIASTTPLNYNNAFCFAYKAEKAGTYEIVFTPDSPQQEANDQSRAAILKNGSFSATDVDGKTSIIRKFNEGETAYFFCTQCDCSVNVQAAQPGQEITSLLVTPAYTDILYGDSLSLSGWKFQLEFADKSKSEIIYTRYDAFQTYGGIDFKLGSNQDFYADGLDLGSTTIQFYPTDFPEIESDVIPITVKKGSEMNFTLLNLNEERDWSSTGNYAHQQAAAFIPTKDGTYQYTIKNVPWTNMVDDEGNLESLNFYNDISEGTFKGKAGIGYTFLASYDNVGSVEHTVLITEIDKSKLQTLYDANKNKSSSGYTSSSWNRFVQALNTAEIVLKTPDSLQREIDKASDNLQSAIRGLTPIYYPPTVDKSSLQKLYDACTAYKEADYTPSSWKGLQEAMKSAKAVLDTSSSQTAIDQAEKVLNAAIAALIKTADKNALKAAYEKYKPYRKDDYTPSTWTQFEKALSAADAGIKDNDLSADNVSKLLNDLETAAAKLLKVGIPVLKNIAVNGNTAVIFLEGAVEKASGYDFVFGNKNCITTKKYNDIRKNILKPQTEFKYIPKGTYYAYCHAWKKVDGKKVFGPWSSPFKFTVTATTPSTPKIKSVSVKGTTVTVTLDKIKGVTSYDAILGKSLGNDSSYGKRPINYGKLIVKSKSNKIIFKNVKKGTYYFGVHAANRTSKDKKKVFSRWTYKKVIVK